MLDESRKSKVSIGGAVRSRFEIPDKGCIETMSRVILGVTGNFDTKTKPSSDRLLEFRRPQGSISLIHVARC